MSRASSDRSPGNWPRFTLRQLLGLVTLLGLALAALVHASLWWAAAWLSGTMLVLAASLPGILYRDGHRRAFWVGFALFGWGYMLLLFGPVLHRHVGHRLATTKLLAYLQSQLQRTPMIKGGYDLNSSEVALDPRWDEYVMTEATRLPPPQWDHFQQVGHSLFALLLAYGGGLVSRWFFLTRSRQ